MHADGREINVIGIFHPNPKSKLTKRCAMNSLISGYNLLTENRLWCHFQHCLAVNI